MSFPVSPPLGNGDNFANSTKPKGPETPPNSRSTSPSQPNFDSSEGSALKLKFGNPNRQSQQTTHTGGNMIDSQAIMERDTNPNNKDEFIDRLYKFLESRGQPITKKPSLGYQELDLHLLYRLVVARGGMDQVTQRQEWKAVYQDLGIPTMSTSASYNTRTNYKKYLYLYELEHCDFPDQTRPKDKESKFEIGQYIRIVSETYQGQVFYAQILKCRFKDGTNVYYIHYNGWSNSHDEWMPEKVISPLLQDEEKNPELLGNPPPSRSSKCNHIISDEYFVAEKHFHPKTPKKESSSGESTPQFKPKLKQHDFDEGTDESKLFTQQSEPEMVYEEANFPRQSQLHRFSKERNKRKDWRELSREIDKLNQKSLPDSEEIAEEHYKIREFNLHQDFRDCYIPYQIDEQELKELEENPFIITKASVRTIPLDIHLPKSDTIARYEELYKKVKEGEKNFKRLNLEKRLLEETLTEKSLTESSSNNGNSILD
jgi:hypothetical protein